MAPSGRRTTARRKDRATAAGAPSKGKAGNSSSGAMEIPLLFVVCSYLLSDGGNAWMSSTTTTVRRRRTASKLFVSSAAVPPPLPSFNATEMDDDFVGSAFRNPLGYAAALELLPPGQNEHMWSKKATATVLHRAMDESTAELHEYNSTKSSRLLVKICNDIDNVCRVMLADRLYLSAAMIDRIERLFWRMEESGVAPTTASFERLYIMQQAHSSESYEPQTKGRRVGRSVHLLDMWYSMAAVNPTVAKPPWKYAQMAFDIAKETDVSMSFRMWDLYERLLVAEDLPRDFFVLCLDILALSPAKWRTRQCNVIRTLQKRYENESKNEMLGVCSEFRPTISELDLALRHVSAYAGSSADATWLFGQLSQRAKETDMPKYLDIYFHGLEKSRDAEAITLMEQLIGSPLFENIVSDLRYRPYHNMIMKKLAYSKKSGSGNRARSIFDDMVKKFRLKGNAHFKPDAESLHHVVMAYIHEEPSSLQRVYDAHRFLRNTLQEFEFLLAGAPHTFKTFDHLFGAYGRQCKHGEAAPLQAADRLFRFFYVQYRDGKVSETPSNFHLGHMLRMLNLVGANDSAERSYEYFQLLKRLKEKGNKHGPDVYNLRQLLSALSQSKKAGYGKIASDLLNDANKNGSLKDIDAYGTGHMFYCAVSCNCNEATKESLNRATELIVLLEDIHSNNPASVRLRDTAYKEVIAAWGKLSGDGAGEQAELMLAKIQLHEISGNAECRVSWEQYADIIRAWIRDPKRVEMEQIQELYDRSRTNQCHHPTVDECLAVAWATCQEEGSLDKAKSILFQLDDGFVAGDDAKRVSTSAWDSLLNAMSKSAPSDKVLSWCLELEEKMSQTDRTHRLVARQTWSSRKSLMRAWSRSSKPDALFHMETLYQSCVDAYETGNKLMKPSIGMVDLLLEQYAKNLESEKAAEKIAKVCRQAISMYKKSSDSSMKPTRRTMWLALATLGRSDNFRQDTERIIQWDSPN